MSYEAMELAYSGCFLGCLCLCLTQANNTKGAKGAESTFVRDIPIDGSFAKDISVWGTSIDVIFSVGAELFDISCWSLIDMLSIK